MKTIGIVGCGAVSQGLLKASESGVLTLPVSGITSRTKEKARSIFQLLDSCQIINFVLKTTK